MKTFCELYKCRTHTTVGNYTQIIRQIPTSNPNAFLTFQFPSSSSPPRQLPESREHGHSTQRADADGRERPCSKLQLSQQVSHPRLGPNQGLAVTRPAEAKADAPPLPPPRPRNSPASPHLPPASQPWGLGVLPSGPSRYPAPLGSPPTCQRVACLESALPLAPCPAPQTSCVQSDPRVERASELGRGCVRDSEGDASATLGRSGHRFPVLFSSLSCARLTQVTAGKQALRVLRSQPSLSFPEEPPNSQEDLLSLGETEAERARLPVPS